MTPSRPSRPTRRAASSSAAVHARRLAAFALGAAFAVGAGFAPAACSETFPKPLAVAEDASAAPKPRPCPPSGVSKGPWALAPKADGVTLRWEACRAATDGAVRYRPEAGGPDATAAATESSFEITTDYGALDPTTPHDLPGTWFMREAKLSGLAPATCYAYALGADAALGGRFCTSRAAGDKLRFFAIGDTNPTLGPTAKLIERVVPERPDFTIHGGDIQYYDSTLETWAAWFPRMQRLLSVGAFLPAIGNHELEKPDEYSGYTLRFFGGAGFDGTDGYYRFSSAGIWFFTVNTERPMTPGGEQAQWLAAKLEDAAKQPGYRFSVVWVHRPFVTCGDTDDNLSAKDALEPYFTKHKVPLVLQAHMHGYERFTLPGRTYVTTAGGGGALGDVDKAKSRAYCTDRTASGRFFHGVMFDVDGATLRGRAIDETGTVRDEFTIAVP